jgi:hypothetical protein
MLFGDSLTRCVYTNSEGIRKKATAIGTSSIHVYGGNILRLRIRLGLAQCLSQFYPQALLEQALSARHAK